MIGNTEIKSMIMRQTPIDFPGLYMEVFVAGDKNEQRAFAEMFVRADCTRASSPDKADLVIFTGGEDVNPAIYGEERHSTTFFDSARDEEDQQIYDLCLENGIPMFGVCRGAQFLHVMNGGRLYQDVDNHNGNHDMWDIRNRRMLTKVSSVHHQMCIKNPEGGMEVIGVSSGVSKKRWLNDKEFQHGPASDIEAYFYRDTGCFGVQGHPEYKGYGEFLEWTIKMIEDLFLFNPDFILQNNLRRMKPDLIQQRNARWAALEELNKENA